MQDLPRSVRDCTFYSRMPPVISQGAPYTTNAIWLTQQPIGKEMGHQVFTKLWITLKHIWRQKCSCLCGPNLRGWMKSLLSQPPSGCINTASLKKLKQVCTFVGLCSFYMKGYEILHRLSSKPALLLHCSCTHKKSLKRPSEESAWEVTVTPFSFSLLPLRKSVHATAVSSFLT